MGREPPSQDGTHFCGRVLYSTVMQRTLIVARGTLGAHLESRPIVLGSLVFRLAHIYIYMSLGNIYRINESLSVYKGRKILPKSISIMYPKYFTFSMHTHTHTHNFPEKIRISIFFSLGMYPIINMS